MIIKKEIELKDFEAWCGAKETLAKLTDEEACTLDSILSEELDGMNETELNDFLWFDTETICEWLGISEEEWEAR